VTAPRRGRHWFAAGFVGATALAGCEPYQPLPLDTASVEHALAPPAAERLAVAAESIAHPILRPVTLDLSDGLSEDEASVLAVLVNPSLRGLRDERALADAQVLEAGMIPNPQLSVDADPVLSPRSSGTAFGWTVGVNWDLAELVSRGAREDSASQHRRSVDLDVAWQEWQAALDAKRAVRRLRSLDAQIVLAQQAERELADEVKIVRQPGARPRFSEREAAAAELAHNDAVERVVELRNDAEEQRLELNRALGFPPDASMALQPVADTDPGPVPDLAGILTNLDQRRLDLLALRLGYQSADDTLRAEILAQFPKLNVGLSPSRDTERTVSLGVGLNVDLPIFDRNQAAIATATATRRQLFDQYVDRLFQARADVAKLLAQVRGLGERIATARAALPSLEKVVRTYQIGVRDEEVDVLSYYQARTDLTAKRIEILDLEDQQAEARSGLELAGGLYDLTLTAGDAAGQRSAADPPETEHE